MNANTSEYIELDLGSILPLSTITTQGEGSNQEAASWTTSYTVETSTDGTNFSQLGGTFTGNIDRSTEVTNDFPVITPTQYIRIYPQDWSNYPALRVGVGTRSYTDVTTFILAIEDNRQDNITQSLNNSSASSLLNISLANSDNNAQYDYVFGSETSSIQASVPDTNNKPFLTMFSSSAG
jgi:hypothetical protein